MIVSFGSKDTEKIWNGERVQKIPAEIEHVEVETKRDFYSFCEIPCDR